MKKCLFKRIKRIKHNAYLRGLYCGKNLKDYSYEEAIIRLQKRLDKIAYATDEHKKTSYELSTYDYVLENKISKAIERILKELMKAKLLKENHYKISAKIVNKSDSDCGMSRVLRIYLRYSK